MIEKKCTDCKIKKSIKDFSIRTSKRWTGYNAKCKRCLADYALNYLKNNPEKKKLRKLYQLNSRKKYNNYLKEIKNKPCLDCKKKYPYYVMDFDHLNPKEKIGNIRVLANKMIPMAKLEKEISKCELVCANCHRIRTFRRQKAGLAE